LFPPATQTQASKKSAGSSSNDDDDNDDAESYDDDDDSGSGNGATAAAAAASPSSPSQQQQQRPVRIERLLANLGYGNRREATALIKRGRVTLATTGAPLRVGDKALAGDVLLDGEPLDAPPPLTVAQHKPVGYVVTAPDDERVTDPTIYDLLPARYGQRRPLLAAVGRLDKATSGLLILTDDGQLSHRVKSPARRIWKVYAATLDAPLLGRDAAAAARRFASGTMLLEGDRVPLLPAALRIASADGLTAEVALAEGRYHQVRRMFAAVGREVVALHRGAIGGLSLGDLPEGEWRPLDDNDLAAVFGGPDLAPSSSGSGGDAAGGSSSADTLTAPAAVAGSSEEEEEEEDEDHPPRRRPRQQQRKPRAAREDPADDAGTAAAAKRYRDSTRWRRRRAALRQDVAEGAVPRGGGGGGD
jgi:16S rRNA pseudouridine516 synthase